MNSTIGIKCIQNNISPSAIMIIRKYYNNEISISEIKEKIETNNYIYVCDYIDGNEIKKILQLYNELKKENIQCELYEHDTKTTQDFLNNLIETYDEIDEEMEYEEE